MAREIAAPLKPRTEELHRDPHAGCKEGCSRKGDAAPEAVGVLEETPHGCPDGGELSASLQTPCWRLPDVSCHGRAGPPALARDEPV